MCFLNFSIKSKPNNVPPLKYHLVLCQYVLNVTQKEVIHDTKEKYQVKI